MCRLVSSSTTTTPLFESNFLDAQQQVANKESRLLEIELDDIKDFFR